MEQIFFNNEKDIFYPVIGYCKVKGVLLKILDVLNSREKYKKLGVKIPNGILFYGEPGTGKTSISKKFMENTNRKIFVIRKNKSDGKFIDEMHRTFLEAKKCAPSIILLDDVDKFSDTSQNNSNSEEYVAIQSLMDDVKDCDVFIIATANNRYTLPMSLRRAGRFDYIIEMQNPKGKEAEEIVKYYLSTKNIEKDVDFSSIAKMLDGRSCAELEKVVNEAGIYAGYDDKNNISMNNLIKASLSIIYETVALEDINDSKYLEETAYHESAHALVAEYLEENSISFISVSNFFSDIKGITIYNKNDDYFNDMKFMENRIKCCLAGKAATEIVFGKCDVGAVTDINRAKDITERFIAGYTLYGFDTVYGGEEPSLNTRKKIEEQVDFLLRKYYLEVKQILILNRKKLDILAEELINKKVMFSKDIREVLS